MVSELGRVFFVALCGLAVCSQAQPVGAQPKPSTPEAQPAKAAPPVDPLKQAHSAAEAAADAVQMAVKRIDTVSEKRCPTLEELQRLSDARDKLQDAIRNEANQTPEVKEAARNTEAQIRASDGVRANPNATQAQIEAAASSVESASEHEDTIRTNMQGVIRDNLGRHFIFTTESEAFHRDLIELMERCYPRSGRVPDDSHSSVTGDHVLEGGVLSGRVIESQGAVTAPRRRDRSDDEDNPQGAGPAP